VTLRSRTSLRFAQPKSNHRLTRYIATSSVIRDHCSGASKCLAVQIESVDCWILIAQTRRTLTRSEIMHEAWGRSGGAVIVSGRSVATLRGKIEPLPSQPKFIHTIRDVGYRFELPDR